MMLMAQAIHVAIIQGAYLDLILSGHKTIESRLTVSRGRAFERVHPGDVIYFKQTSGPFRASARVLRAQHSADLNPRRVADLRREHGSGIAAPAEYWRGRSKCRFATLIWLLGVEPCDKGPPYKSWPDFGPRAAWFTLCSPPVPARAGT